MSRVTKEALFEELKRVYRELDFQRDIGNACEPWEIDIFSLLQKHRGNFWAAALDLKEQMRQAQSQGFYQGMIHELHEVTMKLGVPFEEIASFERGVLGLVETRPGSNVFVPEDEVENYLKP